MKSNEGARRERKYPFKMSRLYVNVATAILAVFMASVSLTEPMLLVLFVLLVILISAIAFSLKIRPLFKLRRPNQQEDSGEPMGPKTRFALLAAIVAVISLPFLLFLSAGALPANTWFIVVASLASGIGISEILYYIYCNRML
jgi:sterol desaturase/sphingolipid hydroxylase (fatty acid hydroxylase superfamily)